MKIIKRERQVRLDELLKYVWDNDTYGFYKTSCGKKSINIREDLIRFNHSIILAEERFTITEEVEITEGSPLDIVVIDDYKVSFSVPDISIREAFEKYTSPKFIYLQNEDGSIGELIWDKERGLVD